jgi:Domain of unknown function (DUF222)
MPPEPVPADPGRDEAPARYVPEPEGPWWEDGWEEEEEPPPEEDEDYPRLLAECREAAEDRAYAAAAAARSGTTAAMAAVTASLAGRRGPGQPGSSEIMPGEYPGRAAQFAAGMFLDVMPGCPELAQFADEAAGPDDSFDGVSDDELLGVLCAWDRAAAHATARKYAAVAELIRRRAEPGDGPRGVRAMPQQWDEFAVSELCAVLAEGRHDAAGMLGLAHDLETKLPGTKAAFLDGILSEQKAEIISGATAVLTPEEAQAAEALVLDPAGRLTPASLRSAISRAVIEVAPDKARKRREEAARQTRVERWVEVSGNAGLAGRELPAAYVHAADQRVNAWAEQLRKAGLDGSMDELRARAFMDLLLGTDSRPLVPDPAGQDTAASQDGLPTGSQGGALPVGFVGRVNLTIPLATLLGLAERPGEIPRIASLDPALARDLAGAAARNPRTTWCVTVTDEHGHAIGHGCARPGSRAHHGRRAKRGNPVPRDGPGFAFTADDHQHSPPDPGALGGYGTWTLRTPGGKPDGSGLIVTLEPLGTDPCDHRYQAKGHDPGVRLRHLTHIQHETCVGIACRRPSSQADFEHNTPYESGGKTCLCNGGPKCRFDHRLKQDPRWKVDQFPDGTLRWTTPSGRTYTAEPTRYPI